MSHCIDITIKIERILNVFCYCDVCRMEIEKLCDEIDAMTRELAILESKGQVGVARLSSGCSYCSSGCDCDIYY